MNWTDMLTMTVASAAAFECVIGRIAALSWREHRHSFLFGYALAAILCIVTASMIWQRLDARWLDWAAWAVAAHLALSWRDWRGGAPAGALHRIRNYSGQVVPSRFDDGGR